MNTNRLAVKSVAAAFIPSSRIYASWWCYGRLCVWHHGLCTDIWQNWQICRLLLFNVCRNYNVSSFALGSNYIERIMDLNHFTDISVVKSYPLILLLHILGCYCSAANCNLCNNERINYRHCFTHNTITAVELSNKNVDGVFYMFGISIDDSLLHGSSSWEVSDTTMDLCFNSSYCGKHCSQEITSVICVHFLRWF